MSIAGLTLIGESINDSVPTTHELLETNNIRGIQELACFQAQRGASYLDVNVGLREPELFRDVVQAIQDVVSTPLSFDSPDPEMLRAALKAYSPGKAAGKKPIINSISELRTEIFDLLDIQPFRPILMCSERLESGEGTPNRKGDEVHASARRLFRIAVSPSCNLSPDDLIIDPSLAPIGADFEGYTRMAIDGLSAVGADREMKGVHMSVGLSNFSVMLPARRKDGSPVRTPLECAFLTLAVPLGLDHVIGSVRKDYVLLDDSHPALVALREALDLEGFAVVNRIQRFYK